MPMPSVSVTTFPACSVFVHRQRAPFFDRYHSMYAGTYGSIPHTEPPHALPDLLARRFNATACCRTVAERRRLRQNVAVPSKYVLRSYTPYLYRFVHALALYHGAWRRTATAFALWAIDRRYAGTHLGPYLARTDCDVDAAIPQQPTTPTAGCC